MSRINSYAIAMAGEQACDWAEVQLAAFPRGTNHDRLLALQAAGRDLQQQSILYASAPEILKACQLALNMLDPDKDGYEQTHRQLKAVIAKATQSQEARRMK